MKISKRWIEAHLGETLENDAICHALTMAGLEVDEIAPIVPSFQNVVIGKVIDCQKHPDADKLSITQVDTGSGVYQIVCGAPNVATGQKVAVALEGAVLPNGLSIGKTTLKGVQSVGMLCAKSELGLYDDVDGIWVLDSDAPIGNDIYEYADLGAYFLDISITPNRGDCFSARGLARELCVARGKLIAPLVAPKLTVADKIAIDVQAKDVCPSYHLARIEITPSTTPYAIAKLLASAKVSLHGLVVDITNFIMYDIGQPMHAFDADKVVGAITVRIARQGETLTLLNGNEITFIGDELVIADEVGVLALAGIMGGVRAQVSDSTRHILLESAFFYPEAIAGRARRFGLHTDASMRYERGVDFNLPVVALSQAIELLAKCTDVRVLGVSGFVGSLPVRAPIALPFAKISNVLGMDIAPSECAKILTNLEIAMTIEGDVWHCTPPSHRFDIAIAVDIIEEIGRCVGYDNLPIKLPTCLPSNASAVLGRRDALWAHKLSLRAHGYMEVISFSFVSAKEDALFDGISTKNAVALLNPISSELALMRRTLLASLLPIVAYNANRQQNSVKIFEHGKVFFGTNPQAQIDKIALVAWGQSIAMLAPKLDFYSLKHDVQMLVPNATFSPCDLPFMHPYQSAWAQVDGVVVGFLGKLHPKVANAFDLDDVWVAQVDADACLAETTVRVQAVSKAPPVRRDLAVIVDECVSFANIKPVILHAAGSDAVAVDLFDIYAMGDKKSLAFTITWQAQHTLDDDIIKAGMLSVAQALGAQFGATLRGEL